MKIKKILGFKVLIASLLLAFATASHAQSGDPIGLILSTSGSVSAEAEDGTVRKLRRRSPVYEGDTVITGTRSRAQIRFNDNGLVALQPETRFAIEEHRFNGQEDGTESAAYRLLRGGMQAITGLIGNRNKNRYRFETPLATIGLRGTHWAVTFCNTSCGDLPPGLYGGVAEGGIDVCNGGGCEGFDKDGYFYVPDENTKPQTLIDPPSVVFDDTTSSREEDDDEESDEESDGSADSGEGSEGDGAEGEGEDTAGEESDGQQADTGEQGDEGSGAEGADTGDGTEVEDDATLFSGPLPSDDAIQQDINGPNQPTFDPTSDDPVRCSNEPGAANSCDTDLTSDGETFSVTQLQSGEAEQVIEEFLMGDTDGDDVPDPIDDDPDPIDVPEPSYTSELGAELSETGVAVGAAIASIQGGGEQAFATTILPSIGDQLRIFQIDGVNTLVGFDIVEFDDFEGTEIDCDPCLQIEQAFYADLGTYTSSTFSADYGRWLQAETLAYLTDFETLDLVELGIRPDIHFGYTEDQTMEIPDLGSPLIATYSYVAGTSPTDEFGNTGSVMDITLDLDFFQQAVVGFDMALEVGDRNYFGSIDPLNSTVYIYEDYLEDIEIDLVGYCEGGDCGDFFGLEGETSLIFLGQEAEGILGSYALYTQGASIEFDNLGDVPFIGVTGAYVLETEGTDLNPFYLLVDDQTEFVTPQPEAILVSGNIADCPGGCEFGFGLIPEVNTFSLGEFNSADLVSLNGVDNLPTAFSFGEGYHVIVDEALLTEFGDYTFDSGAEVNWGRWFTIDADYMYSEYGQFMHPELHFGYSESLADMPSIGEEESSVITYSLVGGTSPTDELGRTGILHNVDLALNFYSDSVAAFNMDLSVGERHYFAELDGSNSYYLEDLAYGSLGLQLIGSCSGDDCGDYSPLSGYAELNLLGENTDAGLAEGILGAYGLYTSFFSPFTPFPDGGFPLLVDDDCCFDSPAFGQGPYSSFTGQAVTGVFVLEQYESPLIVNSESELNSATGIAGFIGATGITAEDEYYSSVIPAGFLVIPGLVGDDVLGDMYTSPITATLDVVDLTSRDGEMFSAVTGATMSGESSSSLGVQEGVLVEYGVLGDQVDLEIYWGGWIGDVAVTESGVDIGDQYVSYLHYVYTDDWTDILPDFAAETFEVWYQYAGGPSPVDAEGSLGNVHYVDMGVNFATQSVSYFGASMAIDGMYYTASFDAYDVYDPYSSEVDTTFVELDGIWTAHIPLEGFLGYCYEGCGPGYEFTYESDYDLVGSATVALAGPDAEAALGTLALTDDDYMEYSATLSFVLQQQEFEYLFLDDFDASLFSQPAGGVAAVANIKEIPVIPLDDEAPSFDSYFGVSTLATNGLTGEFVELLDLDGGEHAIVSAYGTNGPSSEILEGVLDYGSESFGRNLDARVHWGLWAADQSFSYSGDAMDVVHMLPYAYSDNITANMPTSPIVTLDNPELKAEYDIWGGNAFNEQGELASYLDIDMTIDYLNQQISEFDIYAETSGSGYNGYINYYASIDGDGYGEGMGYVDLTGLNPGDIEIPLAGSCNGCGFSTFDAMMQGSANLALVGDNGEAAIGSFYLDSTEFSYEGEDATGLYSLVGAFTLDQEGDGHYFDSTTPVTQSLAGVAVGAAIVDASALGLGDLAVSGLSTDPVGLATLDGDGHIHPNAVVSGTFTGAGQTVVINEPAEAILDSYDNIVDQEAGYEAYWGRWISYEQAVLNDATLDTVGGYTHFGYADGLADVNAVRDAGAGTLHYGLYDYSSPTDQSGNLGSLYNVYMAIDFQAQSITDFDMSLYTSGTGNWNVSMTADAVDLNGSATSNFAVSGTVDHDTAVGNVNTAILGNHADAVLGAYNLSAESIDYEVIGNFLLKEGLSLPEF